MATHDYCGCTYIIEDNPWHLHTLSVNLMDGLPEVILTTTDDQCYLQINLNNGWEFNDTFKR